MKKIVKLRNIELASGKPVICIPLCAKNEDQLFEQLELAEKEPAGLYEWRIDYLEVFLEKTMDECMEQIIQIGGKLRQRSKRDILITFRSKKEGGQIYIMPEEYDVMLGEIAKNQIADLIDVELFTYGEELEPTQKLIERIKACGCPVVASSHDFEKTPKNEELLRRLRTMEQAGADIAKLAVMPQEKEDVLRMLTVTALADEELGIPVITMSMGKLGMLSRIAGFLNGSCLTFGTAGQASAPGQLPAKLVQDVFLTMEGE